MMGETETMLKIFLAEDEIVMREGIRIILHGRRKDLNLLVRRVMENSRIR